MYEEQLTKLIKKHASYPDFCDWLQENSTRILRPVTLVNYLTHLENMRKNYDLELDNPDARPVVKKLRRKVSAATLTLRTFVLKRWLLFKGLDISELKALLKAKKGESKRKLRPSDLLTVEELDDIVSRTQSPSIRAFFMVLFDTGSRPNELCQTNISDVIEDKHGFRITFRHTKNDESRRTIRLLMPRTLQFFSQWLAVHPQRENPDAALFLNSWGRRVTRNALTDLLKKQHESRLKRGTNGQKACLSLYLFRKSRATQLIREHILSEIEIKQRLGHVKHSTMLEQYYAVLDGEDVSNSELRYMGIRTENDKPAKTVFCPNCGVANESDAQRCFRCRMPLTELELIRSAPTPEWMAHLEDKDVKTLLFMDSKVTLFQATPPDELVALAQSLLELAQTMQKTK